MNQEENLRKNNLKLFLKTSILSLFNRDIVFRSLDITRMNEDFVKSLNLRSDAEEELYFKFYLISLVKGGRNLYKNSLDNYLDILYDIIRELAHIKPFIGEYFIDCFSGMYLEEKIKDLQDGIKRDNKDSLEEMTYNNSYRKRTLN